MFRYLFILLFAFLSINAQELNCEVQINFDRVTNANTNVFRTLQTAVFDFMNKTKWTDNNTSQRERIDCGIFINVSEFDNNSRYTASIQVQYSRPIFNTSYLSPVININDLDFSFEYVEFQMMNFDPNIFDSNLISVLAYYAYIIIGVDADTFEPLAGTKYFEIANNITIQAQGTGIRGWTQADGNNNRFILITDLISNTFNPIRLGWHAYHAVGLDGMIDNEKEGKENIKKAIIDLCEIQKVRPNSYLIRIFFEAKADEIQQIFSGGFPMNISDLKEVLNNASPINASRWNNLK